MREGGPSLLLDQLTGIDPASDSVVSIVAAIGPAVRRARLRQRLPQAVVAEQVGMLVTGVSRIESGQRIPRLDRLVALCDAVGVRLSDVLRYAEDETYPPGGGPWAEESAAWLAGPEPEPLKHGRRAGR